MFFTISHANVRRTRPDPDHLSRKVHSSAWNRDAVAIFESTAAVTSKCPPWLARRYKPPSSQLELGALACIVTVRIRSAEATAASFVPAE
jgi:hypothetical protein